MYMYDSLSSAGRSHLHCIGLQNKMRTWLYDQVHQILNEWRGEDRKWERVCVCVCVCVCMCVCTPEIFLPLQKMIHKWSEAWAKCEGWEVHVDWPINTLVFWCSATHIRCEKIQCGVCVCVTRAPDIFLKLTPWHLNMHQYAINSNTS